MNSFMKKMLWAFFLVLVLAPAGWANNLRITNISLEDRDVAATSLVVEFDIDWDNSWRNTTNHDAVWVVLKVSTGGGYVCHADLKVAGLNPKGTLPGTNTDLEIYVPSDKTGAFIRRKSTGSGTVSSQNVRLTIDYSTATGSADMNCIVTPTTLNIQVKVVGVEMVYIPTGSFDAGDAPPDTATGSVSVFWFTTGGSSRPWHIEVDPTLITFNSANTGNFYYTQVPTSTPGVTESLTGATLKLPPSFPKGYSAFYSMKYEITEGLYVNFMNMLGTVVGITYDVTCTAPLGKASNAVVSRNTVKGASACSGTSISTSRPDRAMSYLNWKVFAAMLDWLALRPMTELEYEKMARGPLSPVSGEFAWGNAATVRQFSAFNGSPEDGTEVQVPGGEGNIVIGNATLSQGDNFLGSAHQLGPVRAGLFATSSSTRVTSGAGYYGNMELSGNLWEYVVSVGTEWGVYLSSSANLFDGTHGDGDISSIGAVGRQYWPGAAAASPYYVLYATGTGLRGSSWLEGSPNRARISDRYYAGLSSMYGRSDWGGRGIRTYDGTDF